MIRSVLGKYLAGLLLLLVLTPTLFAQVSSDAIGISAGFARLFGTVPGFSAPAEVVVTDASQQEVLRTPMRFAYVTGRMRVDIDLTQMKGKSVTPVVVNSFKQANLEKLTSIFRLDKKTTCLIFPGVRSYSIADMSKAEAEAAEKNLKIQRTPLGQETVDGHACTKSKVVVKNSKGATLVDAVTWNATDLKDFPVQIQVQAPDKATLLHFSQIQLTAPPAAQFEPPAGFTRYSSPDLILISAADKQSAAQKPPAPQKSATPAKSKTTDTRKSK